MKIYNVGPEELCDSDFEQIEPSRFEWMVYSFQRPVHFGEGEAVCLGTDGLLYTCMLDDCTFYGPLEERQFSAMTIEEFLRPKDNIFDYECMEAVETKVRELLAQR
jgi:hypothetical protein